MSNLLNRFPNHSLFSRNAAGVACFLAVSHLTWGAIPVRKKTKNSGLPVVPVEYQPEADEAGLLLEPIDSEIGEEIRPAKPLLNAKGKPVEDSGPVSVTSDIQRITPDSPLMPEGRENAGGESSDPTVEAKRRLRFAIDVKAVYDDNIFLAARGAEKRDFVTLVNPSISYQNGDSIHKKTTWFAAGYSPSASIFISNDQENSIDHQIFAGGLKSYGRLAVGGDVSYQRLSGATAELSDRVDRNEGRARLKARYDLGGRTSVDSAVTYNTSRYIDNGFADYEEWLNETFIGYEVSGRTQVGLGMAFGRTTSAGLAAQTFQRGLLRLTSEVAGKITANATGGVEFRQTDAGSTTTPVFNLGAAYRPSDGLVLTADVFRQVNASGASPGENLTRTGGALKLSQRLGSRFTAGLEAGYEQLTYAPTQASVLASGRSDDYVFVRPSLKYDFPEGRRAEIYYSLKEDDSSVSNFDFESNQLGLALGFDF